MVIASGIGTGYIRPASGTWGSALAVLLYLPLDAFNVIDRWWLWIAILGVATLIGVWASYAGERVSGEKDSHDVVVDEIVGQWVALSFLPATQATGLFSLWGASAQHIGLLAAAFFLFRLFDVWKPWPIHGLQRLPGGWGIMIDDLLAGLWACILLHLVLRFV
jgi:phosphatidylglycerophosphatase A